jgi:hypothetical protein
MELRSWYPVFERQALFLRAARLYSRAVRRPLRRCPKSDQSEYDSEDGRFRLADESGTFATVDLASGRVHVAKSDARLNP